MATIYARDLSYGDQILVGASTAVVVFGVAIFSPTNAEKAFGEDGIPERLLNQELVYVQGTVIGMYPEQYEGFFGKWEGVELIGTFTVAADKLTNFHDRKRAWWSDF